MRQILITKRVYTWIAFSISHILPFVGCSDLQVPHQDTTFNHMRINNTEGVSLQKRSDIVIHGLLLWASLGFLMPLGTLILRMSSTNINRSSATKLNLCYYFHLILQIASVLLSTAGAVMSIRSFDNSFSNSHQRLGLVLYCAIWIQAVLGVSRPLKGSRKRESWYILHWILGTTILVTGIINTYTGLQAYENKTRKNTQIWRVVFTVEVCFMGGFYLLQDKWEYIRKQQVLIFARDGQL